MNKEQLANLLLETSFLDDLLESLDEEAEEWDDQIPPVENSLY